MNKELCDALRNTHPSREMCKAAAGEIERLAEELRHAKGALMQIANIAADYTARRDLDNRVSKLERKSPW